MTSWPRSNCPTAMIRRCKVLEVDGDKAVVQLFESSAQGINLCDSPRFASWAIRWSWRFPRICWAASSTAWASPIDGGPDILARGASGHQRPADEPGCPRLSRRVYPDRHFHHRRPEHSGPRPEAADILRLRPAPRTSLPRRSRVRRRSAATTRQFAVVFAAMGITFEESELLHRIDFRKTGAIDRTVMFVNLANDPAIERIATPAYGADRSRVSGV